MIELETYNCPHCEAKFTVNQVDCLADAIEDECRLARDVATQETEAEYAGMVDPGDLPITPQAMKELAAAIRAGDKTEAERLVDLIAYDLGGEHENAVQIGRFTPGTARAA